MFRAIFEEKKRLRDAKKKPKKKKLKESEHLLVLTDADFGSVVTQAKVPMMVCFSTPWSIPSRQAKAMMVVLAEDNVGKAILAVVDVSTAPQAVHSCFVKSVPSLIVFHEGQETYRHVGANISISVLRRELKHASERERLASPESAGTWERLDVDEVMEVVEAPAAEELCSTEGDEPAFEPKKTVKKRAKKTPAPAPAPAGAEGAG